MAPTPQTTTTSPTPSSVSEQAPSVLPGLKRGIAVGVASSVCLILIALLAFFALRRRNKRKAELALQHAQPSPDIKELPVWPEDNRRVSAAAHPEKQWLPIPPSPIEADNTSLIYELDANPVPELPTPTKIHVTSAQAQELDALGTETTARAVNIQRDSLSPRDSVGRYAVSEPRYSDVPTLRISPPDMSPLDSVSLLAVSPMAVSPLEEAYLPQSPRSPRSPQNWI